MASTEFIQSFHDRDWPALKRFVDQNFHARHPLRDQRFVSWQHRPPAFEGQGLALLVARLADEIVGIMGVIPAWFSVFGQRERAVFFAHLMTAAPLRQKGLGAAFILRGSEAAAITYTTGYNRETMERIYQKFGWTTHEALRRFVRILDAARVAALVGSGPFVAPPLPKRISGYESETLSSFDERVDQLWERVNERYPVSLERSRAYLHWRYIEHPVFTYHCVLVSYQAQPIGCLVLRTEQAGGFRVLRIIDLFGTSEGVAELLAYALEYGRDQGVHFLDYFLTSAVHDTALSRAGFLEASSAPFNQIPRLFQPLDRTRATPISLARGFHGSLKNDPRLSDLARWYITKGDCDQDRSNIL